MVMPTLEYNDLQEAGRKILEQIGFIATNKYMISGSIVARSDKLNIRTGKTKEAFLGGEGGIRDIILEPDRMRLVYGIDVNIIKGMRLLEDGGTISEKQRRFFWYKYYSSVDNEEKMLWSNLAKAKYFTSRQIVQSSVRDVLPEAKQILNDSVFKILQLNIRKVL